MSNLERRFNHERWLRKIRIRERFQRPLDPELIKGIEEFKRWLKEQPRVKPLCKVCGLLGEFVRNEGRYTRVWGVYKCPEGHEFTHG